jgi:predicted AlkP superfamily pyrophosphatase or phosphodiesterase
MIKRLTPYIVLVSACTILLLNWQCRQYSNKPHRPKLVIGIVVDQMRFDYLYKYYNKWSSGGFKRLLQEGFSFEDAEYNYVPTYTAPGHTSIYTGTTPAVHGMVGNDWFDRGLNRMVYCTEDTDVKTVGSPSDKGMMSPRRNLAETIGDELKLSDNGQSKVIGIALKDRAAILPAGHFANAAYWFDDATGYWITSSYYMKTIPEWVKKFNDEQHTNKYLAQQWNTMLPIASYIESSTDTTPYERPFIGEKLPIFPHNLPELKHRNGGYGLIKATPFGDDITAEFAIAAIQNERLGKGTMTDMLTISFSSTDYVGHQFGTDAVETEDTYLRLDKNINDLLSFLDSYIGKENVVIFLTADHGAAMNAKYLEDHNIPAGYVDENVLVSAEKTDLNKKYGMDPILQFANLQFYLDKEKITKNGLNIDSVEEEVASVAMEFKGVERAIPVYRLSAFNKDFITNKIINGFNPSRSGDVILNLLPNYLDYDTTGTTHGAPYIYDAHVPLIFYGGLIHHGTSDKEENITNIAPTISTLLYIPFPDGCTGSPMQEAMKR